MLIWPETARPAYTALLTKLSFQFAVKSLFSNPPRGHWTSVELLPRVSRWISSKEAGGVKSAGTSAQGGQRVATQQTHELWPQHNSTCIAGNKRIWSIFGGIIMSQKVLPFKRQEKCKLEKKKTRLNLTLTLLVSITSFNLIGCSESSQDDFNHLPHRTADSSDLWWTGTMLD